jgi:signal transduction histidine kinase
VLVAIFDPRAESNRLLIPNQNEGSLSIEILDSEGAVVAATQPDYPAWADHMAVISDLVRNHVPGVRVHEMPEGSPRKSHIVAYAPLSKVPSWGVTVEQNEDVALALPMELRTRMLIFGAVILILGSGLAWFDVSRVVKPLEMLTSASARMAAGDLETPIITTRQDEVGELATTFDVMRVKLRNSLEEIGRWNAELGERVNQRTQELSALFEASQTLTSALSLIRDERETYAQLTARIAAIVGAEKCLIALWQDGDLLLGQSPGYGIPEDAISGFRYNHPRLEAPCVVDRQTAAVGDAVHGLRFLNTFAANVVLTVPLKVQGMTTGIIYAADKAAGFTEHDARLLSIVASQAAIAVENARLYGELQRKEEMRRLLLDKVIMAQEEERKRISRELHDDVGQALTALVMNLGGVEESLSDRQEELRERLRDIRDLASQTLVEIRRLMLDLRPTMLDDLGLIPAISWYAESHLARANIKPHLEVAGFQGTRLPAQIETVLFRVVQEAITNIVKHSGASQATIRLEVVDSRLKAAIEDNGRGFEVKEAAIASQGTLGLTGMAERVSLIGGTLRIDSQPGKGTRLSLEIPLAEEAL